MNISIVKYFANLISPNNDMTAHLQQLFNKYPMVDKNAMGFPIDWDKEPLWQ